MTNDSSSIVSDILAREGSLFTDIPEDRGGPTKFGITLKLLQSVRPGSTVDVLRELTEDVAVVIYNDVFVQPFIRYEEPLKGLLVDSAVQHGVPRVLKWAVDLKGDYAAILRKRISFYAALVVADPPELKFLVGWLNRVEQFIR